MLSTTSLQELKDFRPIEIKIEDENLSDIIMDLELEMNTRIIALERFHTLYKEETLEIVQKLCGMYMFSLTKLLEKYLFTIATQAEIHDYYRLECAKMLCECKPDLELGYDALYSVCKSLCSNSEIATPPKVSALRLLMECDKYRDESKDLFCQLVNDVRIECDYRYKTILSLENIDNLYYIEEACYTFFQNEKNFTPYRILSAQYLLRKCDLPTNRKQFVEEVLIGFAEDDELDYNLRADSADVILQTGSEKHQKRARDIIYLLGRYQGRVRTIFENAQNVHTEEIEESVKKIVQFLSSIETMKIDFIPITFDHVNGFIQKVLKEDEKKGKDRTYSKEDVEKIKISLNRIFMDRAIYGQTSLSLLMILLKLWTYIQSHKHRDELINRLFQELIDMSGTCSKGYITRLCNTLSGVDDKLSIRISWEDQILAYFGSRLNRLIQGIEDEKYRDRILDEITYSSSDFEMRKHFLRFLRENFLRIREELYEEFKDYITDTDFDLYIRKAMIVYEGEM